MLAFDGFRRHHLAFELLFDKLYNAFREEYVQHSTTPFTQGNDIKIAAQQICCENLWDFVAYEAESFVLMPNGKLALLDSRVFRVPLSPYEKSNGFFDIQSGLLERGDCVQAPYHTVIPKEAHLTPFEGCPVYHKLSEKLQILEAATYLDEEISSMELIDFWYQDTLYSYPLGYPVTPVEIEYIEGSAESPDLPDSENLMLKISEVRPTVDASGHGTAPFIVDCVFAAFPNGKGDSKWSDVCDRSGYSRRTILRALETLGRKDEWAKGGQINQ
jgi:hypothetical protein